MYDTPASFFWRYRRARKYQHCDEGWGEGAACGQSRSLRMYSNRHGQRRNKSTRNINDGQQGQYPYQIEFQVQNQGKQISSTKRIIHFRFGFADVTSMLKGKTGSDCRGEEHNIVATWSITGGKKAIMMDEREVLFVAGKHATEARRADMMEAVWQLSDHVYELKCYAYKPATGSPEKRNPRWVRRVGRSQSCCLRFTSSN